MKLTVELSHGAGCCAHGDRYTVTCTSCAQIWSWQSTEDVRELRESHECDRLPADDECSYCGETLGTVDGTCPARSDLPCKNERVAGAR